MGNVNAAVDMRRDGDVAVITVDHLPVNALGLTVRNGIMRALAEACDDPAVRCIVLVGTARVFSGGADITEFGKPAAEPNLRALIAAMDEMAKPVVAAIQGVAFGGGLELALGCRARVAWAGARLALPEVKLGLLPGAGGTQRLPRIVGVENALAMIVSGNPIGAEEALKVGLVDAVLDGPYPDAAVAWTRSALNGASALRRVRDRHEGLGDAETVDRLAAPLLKGTGAAAARACVRSVRNAVTMPFDEGLVEERRLFEELVTGDESRAQRYAFFAEREAQKVRLPQGTDTSTRRVQRAAVIGAGTMGSGIAMCFANAGIPVTLIELEQASLDRGMARIAELYATSVKRGSTAPGEADRRLARITPQVGLEGVGEANVVVEAVFEEMGVKRSVFAELDRLAKPGCVLATNTSYLDIDEIARATSRPADVIGMHFFSPANVMRLLEIVRGTATAPDVIATVSELGKRLGKVSVVVGNAFGFVGNRMLERRTQAAERLLLDGAAPQEVDAALTGFGFRMGPFGMADLAGLDIGMRIRRAFGKVAPVADALCEAGRFGQKTGRGYYLYRGRDAVPDPEVDRIIAAESARLGITRRPIGADEIVERLVYPMVNEGARILEQGIAARPGDIDAIWLHGYNWPAWRGGPMFYADLAGLARVRDRLQDFADATGDETLRPAPMLVRLAAEGGGFTAPANVAAAVRN